MWPIDRQKDGHPESISMFPHKLLRQGTKGQAWQELIAKYNSHPSSELLNRLLVNIFIDGVWRSTMFPADPSTCHKLAQRTLVRNCSNGIWSLIDKSYMTRIMVYRLLNELSNKNLFVVPHHADKAEPIRVFPLFHRKSQSAKMSHLAASVVNAEDPFPGIH